MKIKFSAAILLIGMLALGLAACAPGEGGGAGGGAGASMLNMVPAGNYEGLIAVKPAELFTSEFLTKFKEAFPMASYIISQLKSQMNESGSDIEELDSVLIAGSSEEHLVLFKAGWSEEDLVSKYEEENAVTLVKTDYSGSSYWLDEAKGEAMTRVGDVFAAGNEDIIKKVIDLNAGTGEKYTGSEAFAKAKKYVDLDATITFYTDSFKTMDIEEMKQQLAAEGEDEATVEAVSGAMENLEAVGGSFKVSNAIAGDIALVFTDDASAQTLTDFAGRKMEEAFQEAADNLDNMASMMNLNPDKEKFLLLAEKFTFVQDGAAMIAKINISWDDLAFLFEAPAE